VGIQLPDIEFKVRANTAEMDVAAAKAEVLGEAVQKSVGDKAGQAFVKFGKDGEVSLSRISSSSAKTQADLDQLGARAKRAAEALGKDLGEGTQAVIKLGEDGSAALGRLTKTVEGTTQAVSNSIPFFTGLGAAIGQAIPTISGIVTGIVGAFIPALIGITLALSPLIVTLGAFAAGLTAVLAVLGGVTAGVGILGAAVVLLANRVAAANPALVASQAAHKQLTQATDAHATAVKQLETLQLSLKGHKATADQLALLNDLQKQVASTAYDVVVAQNAVTAAGNAAEPPLQKLQDHLGKVADALGKQAAPMADLLATQLDKVIDPLGRVGSSILSWFGQRLPSILIAFQPFVTALAGPFDRLGQVLSHFFDIALTRSPAFANILGQLANVGVDAIAGLLENLLRLSDWFIDRLPAMAPIVGAVMSTIGSFIQGVGSVAGQVVDWFIANWPKIAEKATWVWSQIMVGWNAVKPMLQAELPAAISAVTQLFGFLQQHSDLVRDALMAIGAIVAVVVGALVGLGVVVVGALAFLELLYEGFQKVNQATSWVCDQLDRFLSLFGKAHSAAQTPLPGLPGGVAGGGGAGGAGLATGGFALPNSVYTVGESGPETLVMGASGGYVVPNAGAGAGPRDRRPDVANDLLAQQNALLSDIRNLLRPAPFSNKAYA
jgi:hypothetical protein